MAESLPVPLVKKPRAVSVVWSYFGLKADDRGIPVSGEEQKPVCRACNRSIPAKGGNTTNLMAHLKEHHPDLHAEALSCLAQVVTLLTTIATDYPLIMSTF